MWHAEFREPDLVAVYDAECPWSRDDDLFVAVIAEHAGASGRPTSRVLDLGCGTGRLALGLAAAGHEVTGVDPAGASLAAARRRPGSSAVTWIEGTSIDVEGAGPFDAAVMTSHVAQLLVDDDEWDATLHRLAGVLVPGGLLAFDSRDPTARAWERWNPTDSRRRVALPDGRTVVATTAVTQVQPVGDGQLVDCTHSTAYPDGRRLQSSMRLRFRSAVELAASVTAAGFTVEACWGGWDRQPLGHPDGEVLVMAHR